MSSAVPTKEMMGILLDEIWDLSDAIGELESRRDGLRDAVLALCKGSGVDRWRHERGSLSIQRWQSYKVAKPRQLLGYLEFLPWHDEVLSVKGRELHRLAKGHDRVSGLFDQLWPVVDHEVLYLTPTRAR